MTWAIVRTIFLRELFDQLRDRRTIFMIFVLPIALYPALGLAMTQFSFRYGENRRTFGISGLEYLPAEPALLEADGRRFSNQLFKKRKEGNWRYFIVRRPEAERDWNMTDLRLGKIDCWIRFPPGTAEKLDAGERVEVDIWTDPSNENATVAYYAATTLIRAWKQEIIRARFARLGQPESFADPVDIAEERLESFDDTSRGGTVWGRIVPFVLVLMALTGAFYPAVDLCAGEKERGTMETLLITPAHRGEIVLGKFLTIWLFSICTTVVNLASMGMTISQFATSLASNVDETFARQLTMPPVVTVLWLFILMLPLTAFFSAMSMALAIFARSTKEGQYYLMPAFVVVIPLVFLTLVPGVVLDPFFSLIPVANVALLMRLVLIGEYPEALLYSLPVLVPTVLYSALALRFAIDQFNREEVLFREAERFEVRAWINHLLRDKEPMPTPGEAWFCFFLILVLIWYSQQMPIHLSSVAIRHIGFVGFIPVVMSLLLTSDPRRTLSAYWPKPHFFLFAILLPITLHPLFATLGVALKDYIVLPKQVEENLKGLFSDNIWLNLLVLGILPAISEEFAFRGFILAGFLRRYAPWVAVAISSILFSICHMNPVQMLTSCFLGFVLGMLVVRSGSILPAIVFHCLQNIFAVWYMEMRRAREAMGEPDVGGYSPTWLILGALGSSILIYLLIARTKKSLPASRSRSVCETQTFGSMQG